MAGGATQPGRVSEKKGASMGAVINIVAAAFASAVTIACCAGSSLETVGPGKPGRADVPPMAPRPTASSATTRAVHCGDSRVRRLERFRIAMSDVSRMAVWREQPAVPTSTPLERQRLELLDLSTSGRTVVLYHYGYGGLLAESSSCHLAVARNGVLCPTVVLPGTVLRPHQVAALSDLLSDLLKPGEPGRRPPRAIMETATPHLSFVIYQGDGRPGDWGLPIGELAVDFGHALFMASPAYRERRTAQALLRLRSLVSELGFPEVVDRETWEQAWACWWREHESGPPLLPEQRLDLDHASRLADLTTVERRRACAWNARHLAPIFASGFEQPGFGGVEALSLEACIDRFPSCPHALERMLPCMRIAQQGDPWFAADDSGACRAARACAWGFRYEPER